MSDKTYYKILIDGKSCNGGSLEWSLPVELSPGEWIPGEWHEHTGEIIPCKSGIHLTSTPYSWYKWGCECYEAEGIDGIECEGGSRGKMVFREVRLLKRIPHPDWWNECVHFAGMVSRAQWEQRPGFPPSEFDRTISEEAKDLIMKSGLALPAAVIFAKVRDLAKTAPYFISEYIVKIAACMVVSDIRPELAEYARAQWDTLVTKWGI